MLKILYKNYSEIGTLINVGAGEDYKRHLGSWMQQKEQKSKNLSFMLV